MECLLIQYLMLEEFNIISRVSDKKPNDAGHPIQYDGTQWFIHTSTTGNNINNGSMYAGADDLRH